MIIKQIQRPFSHFYLRIIQSNTSLLSQKNFIPTSHSSPLLFPIQYQSKHSRKIMFTPALRRNNIQHHSLHSLSNPFLTPHTQPHHWTPTKSNQTFNQVVLPKNLMQDLEPVEEDPAQKFYAPLSSWIVNYPEEVKSILNKAIEDVEGRGVGSRYGLFWCFSGCDIFLWNYNSQKFPSQPRIQRKVSLNQPIRCVALGKIQQKQEGKKIEVDDQDYLLAVGFHKIIDLFAINICTLQIKPLSIKIKSDFFIEHLTISDCNEVLFTAQDATLTRFSLFNSNAESRILTPPSQIRWSASPNPSFFQSNQYAQNLPNCKIFTEKILSDPSTNKIYVLIRKEYDETFFQKFKQTLLKVLSGRIGTNQLGKFMKKQIHVYTVKKGETLQFQGIIFNKDIERKFMENYSSENDEQRSHNHQPSSYDRHGEMETMDQTISSIFLHQPVNESKVYLGVLNKYGVKFVLTEIPNQGRRLAFNFLTQPEIEQIDMDWDNVDKEKGVSMFIKENSQQRSRKKKYDQLLRRRELKEKEIRFSLGFNNLSLLKNGNCVYLNDKSTLILKLKSYPGFFVEIEPGRLWAVFSKQKPTLIKKTQISQILYAYICATEIILQNPERETYKKIYLQIIKEIYRKISASIPSKTFLSTIFEQLMFLCQRKKDKINNSYVTLSSSLIDYAKRQIDRRMKKIQSINSNRQHNFEQLTCEWMSVRENDSNAHKYFISPLAVEIFWDHFFLCWENKEKEHEKYLFDQSHSFRREIGHYARKLLETFSTQMKVIKKWTPKYFLKEKVIRESVITTLQSMQLLIQQRKAKIEELYMQMNANNSILGDLQKIKNAFHAQGTTKITSKLLFNTIKISTAASDNESMTTTTQMTVETGSISQQNTSSSTNEIEETLLRVIPRIISIISLYVEVSEIDIKWPLPSFENFLESFEDQRKIKAALLDMNKNSDLSENPIVTRLEREIPDLKLSSDIFLAKWITKINNQSIKLQNTDLMKLGEKVSIYELKKIKDMFIDKPVRYISILIHRIQSNNFEIKVLQLSNSQKMKSDQIPNRELEILNSCKSIFFEDEARHEEKKKEWIEEENVKIREEVIKHVEEQIQKTVKSTELNHSLNQLNLQETLDFLTKIQQTTFIENIIEYLFSKNLMPETAYRIRNIMKLKKNQVQTQSMNMSSQRDARLKNTAELLHSYSRNITDVLPESERPQR